MYASDSNSLFIYLFKRLRERDRAWGGEVGRGREVLKQTPSVLIVEPGTGLDPQDHNYSPDQDSHAQPTLSPRCPIVVPFCISEIMYLLFCFRIHDTKEYEPYLQYLIALRNASPCLRNTHLPYMFCGREGL